MCRRRLKGLSDSTGVNTLGADENTPHLTVNSSPHPLQIRSPNSLGFIVGVADVVAHGPSLAAEGTDSCHDYRLRILSIICVVE
jgi:hypothetical protein